MLRTNVDKLVKISVMGEVASHVVGGSIYNISATGTQLFCLFDETLREQYGFEDLRLGDLVAIIDADHSFGRIYR
jgi:hypothetical protein